MLSPENVEGMEKCMTAYLGTIVDNHQCTESSVEWFKEFGGISALAKAPSVDELDALYEKKQKEFETVKMLFSILFIMKNDKDYSKKASLNKAAFLLEGIGIV